MAFRWIAFPATKKIRNTALSDRSTVLLNLWSMNHRCWSCFFFWSKVKWCIDYECWYLFGLCLMHISRNKVNHSPSLPCWTVRSIKRCRGMDTPLLCPVCSGGIQFTQSPPRSQAAVVPVPFQDYLSCGNLTSCSWPLGFSCRMYPEQHPVWGRQAPIS